MKALAVDRIHVATIKRALAGWACWCALLMSVDAKDPSGSGTPALSANDYTFSCWLNGWRKNANDPSTDTFGIETSRYGFALDVADFGNARFGHFDNPVHYEQALEHGTEKFEELSDAELLIEVEVDGTTYRAQTCGAGNDKGVKRLAGVRMWESGRYVQHYDFLGLDLRDEGGARLPCDAVLDLVAWPGSLTFNLHVSAPKTAEQATLRLALKGEMGSWSQERDLRSPWPAGERESISMTCDVTSSGQTIPLGNVTVHERSGRQVPVRFEPDRNCYVAPVRHPRRSWRTGYTDIRDYDEFTITVDPSGSKDAIPLLLDLRPPANITGLCPILCDEEGRPTGIPVQLSKNWHYEPMETYLMAYALLPADRATTYTLRLVYGFYGSLPSASHAQLSLIGYGGHGRWDQLAIGCWGETICFDMDASLVENVITDIRMLMTRSGRFGRKWNWTDAGWGGDWLYLQDAAQERYFQNGVKTAYLAHGPCLTEVKHAGYYGANQEVAFSARIRTLRTDDYCRTFQTFRYTFTRDVVAEKMWLYQLGKTRQYASPRISYGNGDGCIADRAVPTPLRSGQPFLENVTLTGPSPWWVGFTGASATRRGKGNGYRALVIRSYRMVVDGKEIVTPTFRAPVFVEDPTGLDIELVPPEQVRKFSRGDHIELDLELITLPREADDYYGPNELFRKHLTEHPSSWRTTYREAVGNDLTVKVAGGTVLEGYPLVIQAESPEVKVKILGGVGAVPIRFEGLGSSTGYRLYQLVNGEQVGLDQAVHGHDYWQTDYDPVTKSYRITYNVLLDGHDESTWVFTEDAAITPGRGEN